MYNLLFNMGYDCIHIYIPILIAVILISLISLIYCIKQDIHTNIIMKSTILQLIALSLEDNNCNSNLKDSIKKNINDSDIISFNDNKKRR